MINTRRFQKTPINECGILSSGKQLSTASGEGEEINDNQQEQLPSGVIEMMDKSHTVLLSKLYDVMKQFRLKRKSQSVPPPWSLLQFTLSSTDLPCPCFHNDTSEEDSLLRTSISGNCQLVDGHRFNKHLSEHHKIFSDWNWNWLWPFMVP
ncbi:unnamed protein product [Didymodactylos carnosus]|uniref:Uncharacterized protein n=1 Tax=Didymodactylos carnosus TaxID=1234261 RepID=A0A815V1V5_9BILA|nr:unnamed protein product [Didymodactylos carnosus]CAF4382662.1 unnamed protein product [Didymodactylos carnosus]